MKMLIIANFKKRLKYTSIVYLWIFLNVLFYCTICDTYIKDVLSFKIYLNSTIAPLYIFSLNRLFTYFLSYLRINIKKLKQF